MRKIFCDICEGEIEGGKSHPLSFVIYKGGEDQEYEVGLDDTCDECRRALVLIIKTFIIKKGVGEEK